MAVKETKIETLEEHVEEKARVQKRVAYYMLKLKEANPGTSLSARMSLEKFIAADKKRIEELERKIAVLSAQKV